MWKLYEIFKVLKVPKRVVSAETICGNTVGVFSAHTKEWADGGDVWILKFTFLDILPIKYVAEMPKAMNIAGRELNIPRIDGQEHSAI